MTEIIDGIYTRTQGYGTPFHTALTCLRCGAMVDGNTYTPVPPRMVHTHWHDHIDATLARLALGNIVKPATP